MEQKRKKILYLPPQIDNLATLDDVIAAAQGIRGFVATYAALIAVAPGDREVGAWIVINDETHSDHGAWYFNSGVAYSYIGPFPTQADDIATNTGPFDAILTASDDEVQKALNTLNSKLKIENLFFSVDGNSGVLTNGVKGPKRPVSWNCTIVSWYLWADAADTFVVDVEYAVSLGAAWNSLSGAGTKPHLNAPPQAYNDMATDLTDLTSWTTQLAQGGWVRPNISGSPTTATEVSLYLLTYKR